MVLAIWPSKPGLVSPNPLIKPTNKPTNKLTLDSLDCDSENKTRDPALILINQQRSWILKKSWLHWVVNLLVPPERLTVKTGSHIYTTQIFTKQKCNLWWNFSLSKCGLRVSSQYTLSRIEIEFCTRLCATQLSDLYPCQNVAWGGRPTGKLQLVPNHNDKLEKELNV